MLLVWLCRNIVVGKQMKSKLSAIIIVFGNERKLAINQNCNSLSLEFTMNKFRMTEKKAPETMSPHART